MTALAQTHRLTVEQSDLMRGSIVRHSLFAERAPAPARWVDAQIERLRDDELTLIWLRKQIARGDWAAIQRGLGWLSRLPRDKIDGVTGTRAVVISSDRVQLKHFGRRFRRLEAFMGF